jgi:aspartate kinase
VKVFKFGGASIQNAERARNVAQIIKKNNQDQLLVVISAMGKTTNALEEIVNLVFEDKKEESIQRFEELKENHLKFANELLENDLGSLFGKLKEIFTEIEWTLTEPIERGYAYFYDQIVSTGELLSTSIISSYLGNQNIANQWIDARDIVRTNGTYRDAKVDWTITEQQLKKQIAPLLEDQKLVLTQGFIGATDENNSTTLGREGSDFSAAIFASILKADSVTIWKDVPSLLSADPKQFENTVPISEISYRETIEMAFYGAQVIHPKTLKPLHNAGIPLWVKCFLDDTLPGTKVHAPDDYIAYPPMMVWKKNQVLISLTTADLSFITEGNLANLYSIFHSHKAKMNIIQNGAIGFVACIDNRAEKVQKLITELSEEYKVKHSAGLDILTIRHYTEDCEKDFVVDRDVLLTQQTKTTKKFVLK